MEDIKKFRYIIIDDDFVHLLSQKESELLPVLGIFRIIPVAKIKNESSSESYYRCRISWDEAITVISSFAKLLLGENVDSQCSYRT